MWWLNQLISCQFLTCAANMCESLRMQRQCLGRFLPIDSTAQPSGRGHFHPSKARDLWDSPKCLNSSRNPLLCHFYLQSLNIILPSEICRVFVLNSELKILMKFSFQFFHLAHSVGPTQVQCSEQKMSLDGCLTRHWTHLSWVQNKFKREWSATYWKGEEVKNFVAS